MSPGEVRDWDPERIQALRLQSQALRKSAAEARARARATWAQICQGRSQQEILQDSAFVRLAARHQTMPVIEQAKGVIMAQQGCGPGEAFDLLRRASQRSNVKLRALAAQIVEHASGRNHDNVTPITLGATRRHG
jgi:ANTAR domain